MDADLAKSALAESEAFLIERLKHTMVVSEALASENPEKYGDMLESSRRVLSSTVFFLSKADSLVAKDRIAESEMDSLCSVYTGILEDFQNEVSHYPDMGFLSKEFSSPFPNGYADDHALNAAVLKNSILIKANHMVGYLKENFYMSGYRLHLLELSTQSVDSNNNATLSVASKLVQQLPHKYIFVEEIIRNGQPMEGITYKAKTNSIFGEIHLDSLRKGDYEIRGQVRAVTPNDRYYEEDFSHHFSIP